MLIPHIRKTYATSRQIVENKISSEWLGESSSVVDDKRSRQSERSLDRTLRSETSPVKHSPFYNKGNTAYGFGEQDNKRTYPNRGSDNKPTHLNNYGERSRYHERGRSRYDQPRFNKPINKPELTPEPDKKNKMDDLRKLINEKLAQTKPPPRQDKRNQVQDEPEKTIIPSEQKNETNSGRETDL